MSDAVLPRIASERRTPFIVTWLTWPMLLLKP